MIENNEFIRLYKEMLQIVLQYNGNNGQNDCSGKQREQDLNIQDESEYFDNALKAPTGAYMTITVYSCPIKVCILLSTDQIGRNNDCQVATIFGND